MRVACAYIPHFYIQAAIRKHPQLCRKSVIIGMPGDKGYVIDCSEELMEKGVSLSMPLKHAHRLCPDAVGIHLTKGYMRIWEAFLFSLADVTLRMESGDPGTAFLDITRLPGIYKNEEQLAWAVVRLARKEFLMEARVGVGNSRFIAREAALRASPVLGIPPGAENGFLSSLPVEQLPVPAEIKERLSLLGLQAGSEGQPLTFEFCWTNANGR